jgi:hypothetical protein
MLPVCLAEAEITKVVERLSAQTTVATDEDFVKNICGGLLVKFAMFRQLRDCVDVMWDVVPQVIIFARCLRFRVTEV